MVCKLSEAGVKKPIFWRQYLIVLSGSLSFFTRGLHSAWPSPSLPILLNKTPNSTNLLGNLYESHGFTINTEQGSWVVVIYALSICAGGPAAAYLMNSIGRKTTVVLTAIPHLIAFVLIAVAPDITYLYIARMLSGFSEGLVNMAFPVYVGEIAHPSIRGRLGCMSSVMIITGLLTINIIGSMTSIANTAMICCVFPLTLILTFSWLPESPYFLVMKKNNAAAKNSLKVLRGDFDPNELSTITRTIEKQMLNAGTFKDLLFIRSNRRALVITMVLEAIQQASGISAIQSYTQIIFIESKQSISHDLSAIIIMSTQVLLSILGTNFIDCLGRKFLLIVSCIGCGFSLILEGLYFYLQLIDSPYLPHLTWLPLTALILYIAVYSTGLAIVLNVFLGELFPANMKGKGLGINCLWYGFLSFVISRFFQVLIDMVGLYLPFWLYAANCFIGAIYIYRCVPETSGKSLDEIQEWLKSK